MAAAPEPQHVASRSDRHPPSLWFFKNDMLGACVRQTPPGAKRDGLTAGWPVPNVPEQRDLERNALKLAQLRDRLYAWPALSGQRTPSLPWQQPHVVALLAHLDVLYDLMEGMQAAFVWKIRQAGGKSEPPPTRSFSLAGLGGLLGAGSSSQSAASTAGEVPQTPQLLLSKCTVALSSDLTQIEVHHAHEVNLVPLTHIAEVCGGPLDNGSGLLDEWCVMVRLIDGHRLSLRFFKRRQVAPFVTVVLALMHLVRSADAVGSDDQQADLPDRESQGEMASSRIDDHRGLVQEAPTPPAAASAQLTSRRTREEWV